MEAIGVIWLYQSAMRKPLLSIIIIIAFHGHPFAQPILSKVQDVFFKPDFCGATLYSEGHIYRGLKVKMNLLTGEVRFIKENSDEIEMTISFRIKKIEFFNCWNNKVPVVFQSGFPVITSRDDRDILYQVLDSGKVMLLKNIKVSENSGVRAVQYGTPQVELQQSETFYVYSPAKGMLKPERSREAILKVLDDKREEVDSYITANNIRFRNEEELVKVIVFYNSLP